MPHAAGGMIIRMPLACKNHCWNLSTPLHACRRCDTCVTLTARVSFPAPCPVRWLDAHACCAHRLEPVKGEALIVEESHDLELPADERYPTASGAEDERRSGHAIFSRRTPV